MKLSYESIQDRAAWEAAGVTLPRFDWKDMHAATEAAPTWVHFGSGSLFRAFHAMLQQSLIEQGVVKGGLYTAETFDYEIVENTYRNITLKSFWKIVVESAKMSGMIVFLIGVSNILGWVMAFTQIPQAISAALLGLTDNPIIILLIMNVILLIAGTFMDVTPAILIFTPLFLPVVKTFGMDPVQFGLILVYNLCIGNITPPVGNTLFVAIKVGRTSLSKVLPYMLGYYVMILLGLLLVTYVPAVSLGLPQMAGLI